MRFWLLVLGLLLAPLANAQIAFKSVATTMLEESAATHECPPPASVADGDFMLLIAGTYGIVPETLTNDEAGWTKVNQWSTTTQQDRITGVWWKFASSESGNYTISHSTSGTFKCTTISYTGVDGTTPLDGVTPTTNDAADSATHTPSAITPATTDAWPLTIINKSGGANNATAPTDSTLRDSSPGTGEYLGVADAGPEAASSYQFNDWTAMGTNADHLSVQLVLRPAAATLEFSAGPTRAAATNGHQITGTLNNISGTATVYAAAYLPAATPPADCDAVQAATGSLYSGSDATWAEDVSDSITISEADNVPSQDVYVCAEDTGTNQTAVTSFTDVLRSAMSGYQLDVLTTLSATAIVGTPTDTVADTTLNSPIITGFADTSDFAVGALVDASAGFAETGALVSLSKTSSTMTVDVDSNATSANITVNGFIVEDGSAYFSPALATGDVAECTNAADNGNTGTYDDGTIAMAADFDMVFTPDAGESGDFHVVECFFQDISDSSTGLFTRPATTYTSAPFYIYYNNSVPTCDFESIGDIAYYGTFTSVDLDDLCTHTPVNGTALSMTHELRTGDTIFTGLIFTESTGVISGNVATEDEDGYLVQFVTCAGGLCTITDWNAYFVNTFTVPNVVGQSLATALSTIETAAPWRVGGDPTANATSCAITSGLVESQSPTATSEASAYATITLTMDNGGICTIRKRN